MGWTVSTDNEEAMAERGNMGKFPQSSLWKMGKVSDRENGNRIQSHSCLVKVNQSTSKLILPFSHQVMSDSFETPWTVAHQAPLSMGSPS